MSNVAGRSPALRAKEALAEIIRIVSGPVPEGHKRMLKYVIQTIYETPPHATVLVLRKGELIPDVPVHERSCQKCKVIWFDPPELPFVYPGVALCVEPGEYRVSLLWDTVHELGHVLNGPPREDVVECPRWEESAWDRGWGALIEAIPDVAEEVESYREEKERALEQYRRDSKHTCSFCKSPVEDD